MIREVVRSLLREQQQEKEYERWKAKATDLFYRAQSIERDVWRDIRIAKFLDDLEYLGEGYGRRVFKLEVSGYEPVALKVALRNPGLRQNKTEVECFQAWKGEPGSLVPDIYDWSPHYLWVEAELLKPVSEERFEELAGISFEDYRRSWGNEPWGSAQQREIIKGYKGLTKRAFQLASGCDLDHTEFMRIEHWGEDGKGNLKVMDFGY